MLIPVYHKLGISIVLASLSITVFTKVFNSNKKLDKALTKRSQSSYGFLKEPQVRQSKVNYILKTPFKHRGNSSCFIEH